jgi:uncharacterized damage-inducible protein DinB
LARTLIEYHRWANQRYLDHLATLPPHVFASPAASSFPSIQETLGHMLLVDAVWLSRLHGEPSPVPESLPTLDAAAARWRELEARLRAFVAGLDDAALQRVITVRTSVGQVYAHPVWEVIQHLINHGTYHRGQLTTILRQVGQSGPATDFIYFCRERAAN